MADSVAPLDASNESGTETFIFNVGGVVFETYRSTLLRIPNGPLADNNILAEHFRPERNDYFFDRDPDAFKIVVNTLRTGKVTIPLGITDPSLKNELVFWGLTSDLEQSGNTNIAQIGNNFHAGASGGSTNREGRGDKIWNLLSNPSTSMWAKLYAALSYILMCLSVYILVAVTTSLFHVPARGGANSTQYQDTRETKSSRDQAMDYDILYFISLVCCLFFMIEYILRVVFAPNRLRFVLSFLGVIDLLAVLPEFVMFVISFISADQSLSLRVLHLLTVFQILRILRFFKHFKTMMRTEVFVRTLKSSFGELVFLLSFTAIGVLVWGTLVYYVETEDEIIFESIPEACWWAIVTMTTVGYGDIFPISPQGKILGSFCAMSGLLVIGLLVSVLVNNWRVCSKEMQKMGKGKQ